jgi:hypothetical protein
MFPAPLPDFPLQSVLWPHVIPILDQGNVGSCTGNATVDCLGTMPLAVREVTANLDEDLALKIYSAAEDIDGDGPYPPNDNGSSGLSVAQAAQAMGLVSGYQHAFGIEHTLQALMGGPVMIGIPWFDSMMTPDGTGLIQVPNDPSVQPVGGHEICVNQCVLDTAAPGGGWLWIINSWGAGWGINGTARISVADMDTLLQQDGDCVQLVAPVVPAVQ